MDELCFTSNGEASTHLPVGTCQFEVNVTLIHVSIVSFLMTGICDLIRENKGDK